MSAFLTMNRRTTIFFFIVWLCKKNFTCKKTIPWKCKGWSLLINGLHSEKFVWKVVYLLMILMGTCFFQMLLLLFSRTDLFIHGEDMKTNETISAQELLRYVVSYLTYYNKFFFPENSLRINLCRNVTDMFSLFHCCVLHTGHRSSFWNVSVSSFIVSYINNIFFL